MEQSKARERKYQVVLSERQFAALKLISSIANGTVEIVVQKGEITQLKPATQRVNLNNTTEREAILKGQDPKIMLDMSVFITPSYLLVKETEPESDVEPDPESEPKSESAEAPETGSSEAEK